MIQKLCHKCFFLNYRKLRKIDLAVLRCLNISKAWIGKQLPADVVRFIGSPRRYLPIPVRGREGKYTRYLQARRRYK